MVNMTDGHAYTPAYGPPCTAAVGVVFAPPALEGEFLPLLVGDEGLVGDFLPALVGSDAGSIAGVSLPPSPLLPSFSPAFCSC